MKDKREINVELQVEELEERIAPGKLGNPGNNNPAAEQYEQSRKRRHRRQRVHWPMS